jgi:hypothetical protein
VFGRVVSLRVSDRGAVSSMNVRITPRDAPQRTDLFGGVEKVLADEGFLILIERGHPGYPLTLPLKNVAEIELDEEPGDFF